ncbi:MAG: oligosaccharide flippase family protein [Bacteroidota bacterium]
MLKKIRREVAKVNQDKHLKELLKGSSNALFAKLLGMVFGYVSVLFISNIYGSTVLGMFSICLTILSIATLIPKFGFDTALIRILNEVKEKGNRKDFFSILKKTSLTILFLSIVFSTVLFYISDFLALKVFDNQELSTYIKSVSFAIIPTSLLVVSSSFFQSIKKTLLHILFQTALINIVFVSLLVINHFLFFDQHKIALLYAIAIYVSLVLSLILLFRFLAKISFKSDCHFEIDLKKILGISYPMLLSNSFALFLGWINILLLGYFISESGVGIYDSTEKLAGLTSVFLIAINTIAAPKFAEAFARRDSLALKEVAQKSAKLTFYTSAPILFIIVIFGNFFLGLFGDEFVKGYWVLFFLCLAKFTSAICGSVGYLLQMTGYQLIFQRVIFLAVLLNFSASFFLIPSYGFVGAAISKCLSVVFWNVVLVIIIKKKFGFWTIYIPFYSKKGF